MRGARPRERKSGPARLLLAACSLLALVSCSSAEEPPVPQGFTRYRGEGYAFDHPTGWQRAWTKDERGRPVLKVDGPRLPSGVFDGQAHLGRLPNYASGDLKVQVGQFRGLAALNGYKVNVSRAESVPDAAAAHRIEATYQVDTRSGKVPFRLLGMYVLTEDRVLVEFMLRSPAGASADAKLGRMFDSFRLTG